MRLWSCALGATALLLLGANPAPTDRFDTVVLDAGHGGEDYGARGGAGLLEKDLVLDITRALAKRLRAEGVEVVLTRADDTYVSLEKRTEIANRAGGDLFVSIHANASRAREARGIETYFLSLEASDDSARQLAQRENLAFRAVDHDARGSADPLLDVLGDLIATEHMVESDEFARLAESALSDPKGVRSRGVKQAPFVVLMGVQMPASLVEIGFITNSREEKTLSSKQRREEITNALARAILKFARRYDARRGVDPKHSVAAGGGG